MFVSFAPEDIIKIFINERTAHHIGIKFKTALFVHHD